MENARQLLSKLDGNENLQLYYLALAYAALPDPEDRNRAFELLSVAFKKGEPGIVFLQIDPRFSESVRKDPRFNDLLASLKLSPK